MLLTEHPGVDINHKNKDDMSVADYLEQLGSKLVVVEDYPGPDEVLDIKDYLTRESVARWAAERCSRAAFEDDVMRAVQFMLELVEVPGRRGRKMIKWLGGYNPSPC